MKRRLASVLPLALLAPALVAGAAAQDAAPSPAAKTAADQPAEPSLADLTRGFDKRRAADGSTPFYDLYQKGDERLLAVLPADYATRELLIACTVSAGDPESGVMGPTHVGTWRKVGAELVFVSPDLRMRADGGATRKMVGDLYSERVLLRTRVLADNGGRPIIDLGALVSQQAGVLFGDGPDHGYGPSASGIDASLARVTRADVFPANVVVQIEAPRGDRRIARLTCSLGALEGTPGYEPREADSRVGYYYDWHVDASRGEFDNQPMRHITRWDLRKADPSLALSPPAKPLVWYVEHTTPVRYRRYVREGILMWNQAFEQIGIAGALEVVQQDATTGAHMEKSPEDVRYNFFRWNMSEAGYAIGPSRTNPRTGEILDADVVWHQGLTRAVGGMLGQVSRALVEESSDPALLAWYDEHPDWDPRTRLGGVLGTETPVSSSSAGPAPSACMLGRGLSLDVALAALAFDAGVIDVDSKSSLDGVPEEFLGPMIRYITAHEVGHCLGLQHNMAASSLHSMAELQSEGFRGPVAASVMDYIAPNLPYARGATGGDAGTTVFTMEELGAYDLWAIAVGYGPSEGRDELLAQSSRREHLFISQGGIAVGSDPRNNTWELGGSNLDWCDARVALLGDLRGKLLTDLVDDGESWSAARKRYQWTLAAQLQTLSVAARWIGGSYERCDAKGTEGGAAPIGDVPAAEQRRALRFVVAHAFEDDALGLTPELVRHLGKDYWYDPAGIAELTADPSFNVHDTVAGVQAFGLAQLLNPSRLRRVYDNEFRTDAADELTLAELVSSVTDSVWRERLGARAAQTSSFRRNLQAEHVARLVDLLLEPGNAPSQRAIASLAAVELERIAEACESGSNGSDPYERAHLADVRKRIESALSAAYVREA